MTELYYAKRTISSRDVQNVIPNGAAGYYLLGIICEKLVIFNNLE